MNTSKDDLRRAMRKLRRRCKTARAEGGMLAAQVLAREILPLPDDPVVSVYWSMGSEMDSQFLRDLIHMRGWREAMPVATAPDHPLAFRAFRIGDTLGEDIFRIPAPLATAPELDPDLLIIPLLAFDRRGGRLGQGGGFYDRTLANLRRRKSVLVVGLAYKAQELPEIPMEPHDQRLDAILTETDYQQFARDDR